MELNITDIQQFDDQKKNEPQSAVNFKEAYAKNRNLITVKKSSDVPQKSDLKQEQKQEINQTIKPIPNKFARISRPQTVSQEPKITYDDILNSIGISIENGKMYKKSQQQINQTNVNVNANVNSNVNSNAIPKNSYIYNKYFKDELPNNNNDGIRRPKSINEYKAMLVHDILQKRKIRKIKSTKLMMPTENINISSSKTTQNLNKLFSFSK